MRATKNSWELLNHSKVNEWDRIGLLWNPLLMWCGGRVYSKEPSDDYRNTIVEVVYGDETREIIILEKEIWRTIRPITSHPTISIVVNKRG